LCYAILFPEEVSHAIQITLLHLTPYDPSPGSGFFPLQSFTNPDPGQPFEKLKRHKSLGIDQIPAELIKAGGRIIRSEFHKLIISIWNKEELPEEWKESVIVPIYKNGDKTDCSNCRGISFCQLHTKFYSTFFCQG
jgi:hypothetical protein